MQTTSTTSHCSSLIKPWWTFHRYVGHKENKNYCVLKINSLATSNTIDLLSSTLKATALCEGIRCQKRPASRWILSAGSFGCAASRATVTARARAAQQTKRHKPWSDRNPVQLGMEHQVCVRIWKWQFFFRESVKDWRIDILGYYLNIHFMEWLGLRWFKYLSLLKSGFLVSGSTHSSACFWWKFDCQWHLWTTLSSAWVSWRSAAKLAMFHCKCIYSMRISSYTCHIGIKFTPCWHGDCPKSTHKLINSGL